MSKRLRFLLLLCLPCFSAFAQKWPSTLLWRISGNGLTQPSYLYGTMHLQDKRLFRFSDSVYSAIEKTDGLALEVNFRDFMDTVLARQIKTEVAELKRDANAKRVSIDRSTLPSSADTLLRKLNLSKDSLSHVDLRKIRNYRLQELAHQEMPTIVDGFLYGLAQRQGKWTGGIEDVDDQLDALDELGGELTTEKAFLPLDTLRRSLDRLMRAYEAQDLQRISDLLKAADNELGDPTLIRRNSKMARRMDSLSALRTMFFAVGAAHLPGDSGVIAELRRRGFTVEPVFSDRKTDATIYAQRLSKIGWTRVDGEDNIYSVDMPGAPSAFDLMGQVVKMKMYFDLTTMTVFMTGHAISRGQSDAESRKFFQQMVAQMGGSGNMLTKTVEQGGAKGLEGSFSTQDGEYRLRLLQRNSILYMLLLGSSKRSSLSTADASRFFSSFVARDAAPHKERIVFSIPNKYLSVKLPGAPRRNEQFNSMADSSPWAFDTYDYVDNASGIYYIVQVRDIRNGYRFGGDSIYFELYKNELTGRGCKTLKEQRGHYQGFPSFRYDASLEAESAAYKTLNIVRGNRVYSLVAVGSKASDFSSTADFFDSVRIDDYPPVSLVANEVDGFITELPEGIAYSLGTIGGRPGFTAFDSVQNVLYRVDKAAYSPLYWSRSDTQFFRQAKGFGFDDSWQKELLTETYTRNGSLPSAEMLFATAGDDRLTRTRMVVSGDTLYKLQVTFPRRDRDRPEYNRFLSAFRPSTERLPTIFQPHPQELLAALQSRDSATFAEARNTFIILNTDSNDLPFLHEVLLLDVLQPELGGFDKTMATLGSYTIDMLQMMGDTSLVPFVRTHYPGVKNENVRANLVEALAATHTRESYTLLAQILRDDRPATVPTMLFNRYLLNAPAELSVLLAPQLVPLMSDSTYGLGALMCSAALIREGLLDTALVVAHAREVYQGVRMLQARSYSGFFKAGTAMPLLMALLRRGQPADTSLINRLAAQPQTRWDLYNELRRIGRVALMSPLYATQPALAESLIYSEAIGIADSFGVSLLGERYALYKGKRQKFYAYKFSVADGEMKGAYLAIAGPYTSEKNTPNATPAVVTIDLNEPYSPDAVDAHISRVLKQYQ